MVQLGDVPANISAASGVAALALGRWDARRRGRAEAFLMQLTAIVDNPEAIPDRLAANPDVEDVVFDLIDEAMRTSGDRKRSALVRAARMAVERDMATIDHARAFTRTLRALDEDHIQLLATLHRIEIDRANHTAEMTRRQSVTPLMFARITILDVQHALDVDQEAVASWEPLFPMLQTLGLMNEDSDGAMATTLYGRRLLSDLLPDTFG